MRKKLLILLIFILFAAAIEIPDLNVTGINITGLLIGLATKFLSIMKIILKEVLLAIANML